jgi:hypothetical protein
MCQKMKDDQGVPGIAPLDEPRDGDADSCLMGQIEDRDSEKSVLYKKIND